MGHQSIKLISGLALFLIVGCAFMNKMNDNHNLLPGKWKGAYEQLKVTLIFQDGKGSILYLPSNKRFSFDYSFKNDSVVKFISGKAVSYHQIRLLDKSRLQLIPYPANQNSESIDLIDQMEFVRE